MPRAKKVPRALQKAIDSQGIKIPQLAELVSHFMALAGGPKLLAKMLFEEFLNAKAGSVTRQRILDSILKMLSVANHHFTTMDELDMMTQADIESEISRLMTEIPDGEEEKPTESVQKAVPREGAGGSHSAAADTGKRDAENSPQVPPDGAAS